MSSTRSVAQCGVSLAGLKTTVLPVTSAGIIFQHGMAIGKFQGVMIPATPIGWRMLIAHLSGSSRRHRVAEHPAALAGHQVGDVDAFLDVAAGLRQDLAHLAGHRPGEALLVLGHERAERVQDLAALRAPACAATSAAAVSAALMAIATSAAVPCWKRPMTSRRVGRVAALERGAAGGLAPLPGDEVAERRRIDSAVAVVSVMTASVGRSAPRRSRPAACRRRPRWSRGAASRRKRGSHQFHSPSSRIVAGSSTLRTIVASRNTATASPNPSCLMIDQLEGHEHAEDHDHDRGRARDGPRR